MPVSLWFHLKQRKLTFIVTNYRAHQFYCSDGKVLNEEDNGRYFPNKFSANGTHRSISSFIVILQFSPWWPRAKTCIISIGAIVSIPPENMMYIRDTLGPVMTRSWHQTSPFHYTRIWHIPSSFLQALTIFSLNVSFHLIDCKLNFLKVGY